MTFDYDPVSWHTCPGCGRSTTAAGAYCSADCPEKTGEAFYKMGESICNFFIWLFCLHN